MTRTDTTTAALIAAGLTPETLGDRLFSAARGYCDLIRLEGYELDWAVAVTVQGYGHLAH